MTQTSCESYFDVVAGESGEEGVQLWGGSAGFPRDRAGEGARTREMGQPQRRRGETKALFYPCGNI